MSKQATAAKATQTTAQTTGTRTPPRVVQDTATLRAFGGAPLPVTDPRRKLTKAEKKAMTKEQRKERRTNREALRGAPKERVFRSITKISKSLLKIGKLLDGSVDKTCAEIFGNTAKALNLLGEAVADLPEDWKPKGGEGKSKLALKIGDKVSMKADRRKGHDLTFSTEALDAMTVVQIAGKRGVFKAQAKDGEMVRLFLMLGHVEVAKTEEVKKS